MVGWDGRFIGGLLRTSVEGIAVPIFNSISVSISAWDLVWTTTLTRAGGLGSGWGDCGHSLWLLRGTRSLGDSVVGVEFRAD